MTLQSCIDQACTIDGVLVALVVICVCAGIWMSDPGEVYKTAVAGLVGAMVRGPKA